MTYTTQCWSREGHAQSGAIVRAPAPPRCRPIFAWPGALIFALVALVLAKIADPEGWRGEAHH